jgi:hypothetical protein
MAELGVIKILMDHTPVLAKEDINQLVLERL